MEEADPGIADPAAPARSVQEPGRHPCQGFFKGGPSRFGLNLGDSVLRLCSCQTTVSVAPKQAASATRKPTPPRNDNKASATAVGASAKAGALAGPNEPRGRKRPTLSPSASDDAPEPKRATRVQNGDGVTGLSTTGRSLRVRAPKAVEVKPEAAIAAPARPTRASAQKARSRLKPESDVDDEGSEDGGGATSVGAQDGEGGAQPQEAEDSEDGFEFDDDF